MRKHLLDLEKFKYDKNCKYCIKNGQEQINEKKHIKKEIKIFKQKIIKLDLEIKSISKNYNKKKKELDRLDNKLLDASNRFEKKE